MKLWLEKGAGREKPKGVGGRLGERLLAPCIYAAARHPIEVIAVCAVVALSCYLSLIDYVQVFAPARLRHQAAAMAPLDLSHKRISLSNGQVSVVDAAQLLGVDQNLLLKQVIVEAPAEFRSETAAQLAARRQREPTPATAGALTRPILRALAKLERAIRHVQVHQGGSAYTLEDVCFRAESGDGTPCLVLSPLQIWQNDVTQLDRDADLLGSVTSALKAHNASASGGLRDAWFRGVFSGGDGVRVGGASALVLSFVLDVSSPIKARLAQLWEQAVLDIHYSPPHRSEEALHDQRGTLTYFITTAQLTIREFWQTTARADLVVFAVGFVLMHVTFAALFVSMRRLGSKFTLGFTVICSGLASFSVALVIARWLDINVSAIQLSEAVPFLVSVIGFDKPYLLTKAVLSAPTASGRDRPSVADSVVQSASRVANVLLADALLEIAVLLAGYLMSVPGLSEVCRMAAIIVACDFVFLFTLYIAALTLKLELQRVRESSGVAGGSRLRWAAVRNCATSASSPGFSTGSRVKLLVIVVLLIVHGLNGDRPASLPVGAPAAATAAAAMPPLGGGEGAAALRSTLDLLLSAPTAAAAPAVVHVAPPLHYHTVHYATGHPLQPSAVQEVFDSIVDLFLQVSAKSPFLHVFVVGLTFGLYWLATLLMSSSSANSSTASKTEDEASSRLHRRRDSATTTEDLHAAASQVANPRGVPRSDSAVAALSNLAANTSKTPSTEPPPENLTALKDPEIAELVKSGSLPAHALEKRLGNPTRAVAVRRLALDIDAPLLPFEHFDYTRVTGVCCENVIGFVPLPLGLAGPYTVDGERYHVPMATTEGCLVASTSRGCKAISACGGAHTVLVHDGMTRGPALGFPSVRQAAACKQWLDAPSGFAAVKAAFDSTSRFARLQRVKACVAGRTLFVRFVTHTGDAMGMNMISKGVEQALVVLGAEFPAMRVVSLSGNFCTDKKPAAINWVEGRGKSVVAEATVRADAVRRILKTTVDALVELGITKNLVGSAMAGSVGGFNAHAANILTAVFLATGQDPAQNVESSQCITLMEKTPDGDLHISCSMPCIEVGTVGGGTSLGAQAACLQLLRVRGPHPTSPGSNAQRLARLVCASVMAGELSLCAALAAGHLVKSHMAHNRQPASASVASAAPGTCIRS